MWAQAKSIPMVLWDTQGWEQCPHAQERRESHCLGARRADQGLGLPGSGFVTVALSGVLRLFHSSPWYRGQGTAEPKCLLEEGVAWRSL